MKGDIVMVNLKISLQAWQKNCIPVKAVEGETGSRMLTITFLDSAGQPVVLTGCIPRMYVSTAHSPVFHDGTIVDAAGGTAQFVITSDMTANHGIFPCQFLLYGSNFPALKFDGLTLHVDASDLENAVDSTNEFSSLVTALDRTENAAKQAEQALADASSAVATATAAKTGADTASQNANNAASQARNVPKIGTDGYWYTFNPSSSQYEKTDKNAVLIPKGAWSAGTYGKGEFVFYAPDNATYCSLKDGNTATPGNDSVNWMLLCKGAGVPTDNNFTDAYQAKVDSAVPNTRQIAGLALSGDITLAQLAEAGLASGDSSGNAQNALKLGGVEATKFPNINTIEKQTLTLLNSWKASWGQLDVYRFGRVLTVSFNGYFTGGTAGSVIANLPSGWNPSGSGILAVSRGTQLQGNLIIAQGTSINMESFTVIC